MNHLPEKHKGILHDANSILSWNAIDVRADWPTDIADAFNSAMLSVCNVLAMIEKEENANNTLKTTMNMVEKAFDNLHH